MHELEKDEAPTAGETVGASVPVGSRQGAETKKPAGEGGLSLGAVLAGCREVSTFPARCQGGGEIASS